VRQRRLRESGAGEIAGQMEEAMNTQLTGVLRQKMSVRKMLGLGFCAVLLVIAVFGEGVCLQAAPADEYALKAAFIINFARFTQWPARSAAGPANTLELCVAADPSVRRAFRQIDGQQVDKRFMRVIAVEETDDLSGCALLFIGRTTSRDAREKLLAAVAAKPVLTIGETKDFARLGGVMNFIMRKGGLHFEINPETARQQKLTQSSRLLQLATIVAEKKPEDR